MRITELRAVLCRAWLLQDRRLPAAASRKITYQPGLSLEIPMATLLIRPVCLKGTVAVVLVSVPEGLDCTVVDWSRAGMLVVEVFRGEYLQCPEGTLFPSKYNS